MRALASPADPVRALTDLLRQRYRAPEVVLTGSGTQALELALRAAVGSGDGKIVALPAFSCYDIVSAAVGAAVQVRFYDVHPGTLGADFDSLEGVLAAGAGVVVVAPLYGIPWDWDRLESMARRTGAVIVEDAAQAQGAEWLGQPLGSFGDLSVLSFGRGKGWTGGAGGALLIRDPRFSATPEAIGRLGDVVAIARAAAQWLLGRPALYGIPHSLPGLALGESVYHPPAGVRAMGGGTAAMILGTRSAAEEAVEARRRRAEYYAERLRGIEAGRTFEAPRAGSAGWLRYPVLWPPPVGRSGALRRADLRLGIAPSYPRPLPELPAVRRLGAATRSDFPGAAELAAGLVTLPTHGWIADRDADRIVDTIRGLSAVGAS